MTVRYRKNNGLHNAWRWGTEKAMDSTSWHSRRCRMDDHPVTGWNLLISGSDLLGGVTDTPPVYSAIRLVFFLKNFLQKKTESHSDEIGKILESPHYLHPLLWRLFSQMLVPTHCLVRLEGFIPYLKISSFDSRLVKRNWSDSSDNSLVKTDTSRWSCKKNKQMKSSYKQPEVSTANGKKAIRFGRFR